MHGMKIKFMFAVVIFLACAGAARASEALETAAIQGRIDAAAKAGGGEVVLEPGDHVSGGLFLRDNVTLRIPAGARLVASTNSHDYVAAKAWDNQLAFVLGAGVTNAAVVGEGEIDGRGWAAIHKNEGRGRWKDILFYRAKDVRVEGVTLRDAATWVCHFRECDGVVARKVKIRSLANYNNDGIDIEAKNVLVEDCDIEAEDDGICFKSDNADFIVEKCLVRNCRISSNCNFIKFGTSSKGVYRDIEVRDCQLACTGSMYDLDWSKDGGLSKHKVVGVKDRHTGISGIALEVVDGGAMERVTVRNITMGKGVQTPIFIRQGARRPPKPGRTSELKDILIENVTCTEPAASLIACSITGVPGLRPHDITLRNCKLRFPGGATAEDAAQPFGEAEKNYPENRMFGPKVTLPAYGLYIRHADRVRLENVTFEVATPDARPPLVKEDVRD